MPNEPISVFISYSRTDSDFVDRLEADLRARNFPTWVDRHKLEGGQIWIEELEKAIQRCHVLLVVLSPEAVVSEFVRKEYRYAQNLKKPVIPLLYRAIPSVPLALNDIQWIKFNPDTYGQGLNDLLIALNPIEIKAITEPQPSPIPTSLPPEPDPSHEEPVLVAPQPAPPPPEPNLNDLYKAGVMAKVEDNLERTAILWQQILDRDPYFKDGTLAPQLKLLLDKLYLIRVQRLRDQAEQAHLAGELGQEIGAWRALLGLEPEDIQAKARIVQYFRQQAEQAHSAGEWKQEVNALQALLGVEPKEARALERISVAEHNQKNVWLYENAQQFVEDGYLSSAKMQLEMLWQNAPILVTRRDWPRK